LEIEDVRYWIEKAHVVIHAAAVVGTGKDPFETIRTNVSGTANVASVCAEHGVRLIYISTDYVFDGEKGMYREFDYPNPISVYGKSKLAGEYAALSVEDSLVIRTSFCHDTKWKYPAAFIDQYTSRDRVSVIAPQVLKAARICNGIIHIGTERKSLFDLARSIDENVKPARVTDQPRDVSLNCERWERQ
jgi:dTDP-4-dehydrorhamnose reductase